METSINELTTAFETDCIDAILFKHKDHVAVAYGLLSKYLFEEATFIYASKLRKMTTDIGAANKFNMTITLAFMGLIAERMNTRPHANFVEFMRVNPDLLDKHILDNWYSSLRLHSPLAKSIFILPDTYK